MSFITRRLAGWGRGRRVGGFSAPLARPARSSKTRQVEIHVLEACGWYERSVDGISRGLDQISPALLTTALSELRRGTDSLERAAALLRGDGGHCQCSPVLVSRSVRGGVADRPPVR
jgi:hypothetical protein